MESIQLSSVVQSAKQQISEKQQRHLHRKSGGRNNGRSITGHYAGNPMDIANMVLFLCSEKAGFITGENICIDGGMTKQMIYHGDCGWRLDMKI